MWYTSSRSPSTHRELALKAIEAGKHVVYEKPISISLDDAAVMVQAAEQADVKLRKNAHQTTTATF